MSRFKLFRSAGCAALCLLGTSNALATLLDRGPDMVYDTALDITWTRKAGDGVQRNWENSVAWANTLEFAGFDDWRLPWASVTAQIGPVTTNTGLVDCNTSSEIDCRDNEMGYMFYYNLGGTFGQNMEGAQSAVGGQILTGIQVLYWSGTEFSSIDTLRAWAFLFLNGFQGVGGNDDFFGNFAWAVRDGDVAAVPEPATLALLALGIAGLGFGRRSRSERHRR